MMKIILYIFTVAVAFMTWSCSFADIDPYDKAGGDGVVQFVPRIMPFGEIDTKANKTGEEQKVTSMAMVVFDAAGKCIYFQYYAGSENAFLVDPDNLAASYPNSDLTSCSVYAFANMPVLASLSESDWKGKPLSYFTALDTEVTGVAVPSGGFPMMGGRNEVNLDPEGNQKYLISLEMYCAYAKITVNIGVNSPLDIQSGQTSYFIPGGWEVHNVASDVDFDENVETSASVLDEAFSSSAFRGSQATSSSSVSFSFYVPERLIQPANKDNFVYPFVEACGGVLRPEDENLRQKYKPSIVSEAQKATYVSITGKFVNHQGHRKDVKYDLYIGENNYDDFNVKRNIEYTNNVTIHSLTNHSDPEIFNLVSYDGRVSFSGEFPYMVSMERETLFDAHFEVRPIRVNVKSGSVRVSVLNPNSTQWVRIENAPKRKYFTTDLLQNLKNSSSVDLGVGEHCVWMYVDQNVTTRNSTLNGKTIPIGQDGTRLAVLNISYYTSDKVSGNPVESLDYSIAQRYLYPVRYTSSSPARDTIYNIEYHEEYLYNYDPEDPYGITEFEGMTWGLEGLDVSNTNRYNIALEVSGGLLGFITDVVNNSIVPKYSPYYDFYLPRDNYQLNNETIDVGGRAFKGHLFSRYLIRGANKSPDPSMHIGSLTLDEDPKSAVEYCLNKNRRDDKGNIVDTCWYLPAVDEIEEITKGGYEVFNVFQNKYFWSSQPSYYRHSATIKPSMALNRSGIFMTENTDRARATKVNYDGDGDFTNAFSGVPQSYSSGTLTLTQEGGIMGYGGTWKDNYSATTGNYSDSQMYEEGNMSRERMNRVRCVYRPK